MEMPYPTWIDENLVTLLRQRVERTPDARAYVFLTDGERQEQAITYKELDSRARRIAGHLQANHKVGERALLLYPPGLDYIIAFFACLYAGVIAVPVYPPSRRYHQRLKAIIHDAAPSILLTTTKWQGKLQESWGQNRCNWLATDRHLSGNATPDWKAYALKPDSLAFLQYTSGSTGTPKGVMVSHGNLMANQRAIQTAFNHSSDTIFAGWLPFYHDMGLIGNILQPLYLGVPAILMSPMAFLEKPFRWLNAISKYRATTSGGPNFAYELCARKITPEQTNTLDLSCWTLAFNGSEPIRAATMERFAQVFADSGFRRESLFPCYGLAEATLFVTGGGYASEPKTKSKRPPVNDSSHQLSPNLVNCGQAGTDHQICIVNPETRVLCPDGTEGEIWVKGPSVAQGYWNQLIASAETFRARLAVLGNHKLSEADPTYLRTGDLGMLTQGDLYVTGRLKDLIILRGHNYFPHDFEQALDEGIDALRPGCSAAFSINHENEERLVIAAEVRRKKLSAEKANETLSAMRQALSESSEAPIGVLALVPPGSVPKTTSGKIQRQACKQAYMHGTLQVLACCGGQGQASGNEATQGTGQTEKAQYEALSREKAPEFQLLQEALNAVPQAQRAPLIARFIRTKVSRLLGTDETGLPLDRSLRSLGLDSLRLVEIKHAVDQLLGSEAPFSLFLSDRTLVEVAEALAGDTPEQGLEFSGVGRAMRTVATSLPSLERRGLSSTQLSMWAMQQQEPGSIVYNLHLALGIEGAIDRKRLRQAFHLLAERHDMLRTLYRAEDREVMQQVLPLSELPSFFTSVDASAWSEAELQHYLAQQVREPFDLSSGSLFRAILYHQGAETSVPRHTLLLCAHHIAVDLWSALILVSELGRIYAALAQNRQPALERPAADYAAFVTWQQHYLESPASERDWDYWRRQLAGELPILALPADRLRPAAQEYRGVSTAITLSRDATVRLKDRARQQGVTLFTLLLAAYKVLLYRTTHQQDLIVGVPASGRSQGRFASVVGNFVNPLPLRSHPAGSQPFSAYLAKVSNALLGALEHQDFPFSLMVERLQPERRADHWPIYQTLFVLQQAQAGIDGNLAQLALGEDGAYWAWGDWQMRSLAIEQRVENFDLKLMAAECQEGLRLSFQYRSDLFERATIARLSRHFEVLLQAIAADPEVPLSDLPLLPAAERRRILVEWNATESFEPTLEAPSLHRLFEMQVEKTPEAVAVIFENRQLTYRELNARSNRLAHALIRAGVRPDIPVGICARRSLEMVIGLLGILKAGGAYLPLDPDYPEERLSAMVADAQASWILAQSDCADTIPDFAGTIWTLDADEKRNWSEGQPAHNPDVDINGEMLAYVLFTSGSTGRPKGVGIPHKGVWNRLQWMQDHFRLNAGDTVLQKTPYTFDVSVWEFFWPLITGARLIMAAPGDHREPQRLVELIEQHGVTTLHFVPSMLSAFLETADFDRCTSLRRVICSGEALQPDLRDRFFQRSKAELHNLYGPTEASIDVTAQVCERERSEAPVPIGRPIANTQIYLLDARLNPVPAGLAGEIYIGGVQLARGYLNRPDLTAERFVPNPFGAAGERLYRSGDLARYRPDGVIEYLGRIDHQVKVRGFRIELGEIETRLKQHPGISEAVVLAREDSPGDKRLVAYLVRGQESMPEAEEVRTWLGARLPGYMVPAAFVTLERLPMTGNGKLDRKALPTPDFSAQLAEHYVAPRSAGEAALAKIWAEVLRVKQVGIHDNFFALGGDSILAIQAASRARQAGIPFTPRQLFEHQTVAELAEAADQTETAPFDQSPVVGEIPLTPIQRWFFEQGFSAHPSGADLNSHQAGFEGAGYSKAIPNPHHWNQAILLEAKTSLDWAVVEQAMDHLVFHHDALRARFLCENGVWRQTALPKESHPLFEKVDLRGMPESDLAHAIEAECARRQAGLNLGDGPLLRMVGFDLGERQNPRLLIVVHHLVVDGVSWRILLEDLERIYSQLSKGEAATLPPKTSSFKRWAEQLQTLAPSEALRDEVQYWIDATTADTVDLPVDYPEAPRQERDAAEYGVELNETETRALLREAPAPYRTGVDDLLHIALLQAVCDWCGSDTAVIDREGHGREELFEDIDLSRTVGWFTSMYPVKLQRPRNASTGALIKAVKEQLSRIPRKGIGYGLLRYLEGGEISRQLAARRGSQVLFNYLGQLDQVFAAAPWCLAQEKTGLPRDPNAIRAYELEINAQVSRGRLQVVWRYGAGRYRQETIARLADRFIHTLQGLIAHCLSPEAGGITPSDFPLANLSQEALDALPYRFRDIEDIYPLSPMQEGMLFDTLMAPQSGIYVMQDRFDLRGSIDGEIFRRAWQRMMDRHAALRTSFLWETLSRPCQIVHRRVQLPFEYHDWRTFSPAEQEAQLEELLAEERQQGFDFLKPPLMTIRLFRLGEDRYCFVRSYHHILMDAWCLSLLLVELRDSYEALYGGQTPIQPQPPQLRSYIDWLQRRNPQSAKAFWQQYLQGFTGITPLNVDKPVAAGDHTDQGVGDAITFLSERATEKLNALAQQYRLTPNTFIQAAWALLLSRYSGQEEVLFGATVSGRPTDLPGSEEMLGVFINTLPLRVAVRAEQSLLDFLQGLLQRNIDIRQHEYTPLVQIQGWSELPREQPLFESLLVFENYPVDPSLRSEAGLFNIVGVDTRTHTNYPLTAMVIPGERLHLQITYYRSRFEREVVERMLGHFRCLLEGLIYQPQFRLGEFDILTEAERRAVLYDWNPREPGKPAAADFSTLFEAQANRTPEAVAAACGDKQLSFRELNSRANRIAHSLIRHGVGPEVLVALVDERDIDLLVAILAVFKAGGAYLPLDAAYPPARIKHIIKDSYAALVIAGPSCPAEIRETVNGGDGLKPPVVSLDELETEKGVEQNQQNPIPRGSPRNLAYVIYTSGSTGAPKGAMVERAGMLNNLLSKIPELNLGPGDAIAQTASQCFDISVWQFLTGLVCGARVEIIPNAVVQDPDALLDTVATRGITVLELVPSLISALLDAPATMLSRLRWLLPTGEAFPVALCRRWLARYPHVRLLNAYGPAECSDDVAYHRITAPPHEMESRIPIGRSLPNIRLYVLDRTLQPVPVGVPGELCIAGVGVGRGYLGRSDLTAEAFVPDPFTNVGESGGRLYRTGDRACYRPDGTLEYLGRIDHQVKVRGFRIEPGEIEAKLLVHPQIKEAIVLAREDCPGDRRLVAYIVATPASFSESEASTQELLKPGDPDQRQSAPGVEFPTVTDLRAFLKGTLPEYMLPSVFVFLEKLPLNTNGKVDRKRLPIPDMNDQLSEGYVAPRTPIESQLAKIWGEVLHLKQVGIHDNFFELGGDSILSLQIVSRARQAGLALTPRQVFDHPQIAALAEAAERVLPQQAEQGGPIHGEVALTPIQRWFFEQQFSNPHHWNQAVLLKTRRQLDPALLQAAIPKLLEHHDALRLRFSRRDGEWHPFNLAEEQHEVFTVEDLSKVTDEALNEAIKQAGEHWQASLNVSDGPLMRVIWFDLGPHRAPRLLMVIHHLVVDGVSWRILLEDLDTIYHQLALSETVSLPPKTTSFRQWSQRLHRYVETEPEFGRYWSELAAAPVPPLPVEKPEGANIEDCTDEFVLSLDKQHTQALLQQVPPVYRTRIDEVLLAALAQVLCRWSRNDSVLINLEGHGREDLFAEADLSRTVGWFTSLFPVHLAVKAETGLGALLQSVKEQLRAVPDHGISYGIQRYLGEVELDAISASISFNYLGQLDQALPRDSLFEPATESAGACFSSENSRVHEWEIVSHILDGCLHVAWRYSRERYHRATIEGLCRRYLMTLESLIEHCLLPEAGGCTSSDFPLALLEQAELDRIVHNPRNVEDIYPLGPMQEGLLLHTLMSPHSGIYLMQDRYELRGHLERDAFRKAWQQVVDTHTVLRTAFVWNLRSQPHQIVYKKAEVPFKLLDWRGLPPEEQQLKLGALLQQELETGLPLEQAPVLRIRLIRLDEDRWIFARSHHHVLLDAWCLSLLLVDFLAYYEAWLQGQPLPNKKVTPYREYIKWLQQQDAGAAEAYWRESLQGFTAPTYLSALFTPPSIVEGEARVADEILSLSREDTQTLQVLAKQHQLTSNTFLQAAWALLMAHYLDKREVLLGVTVAGRPPEIEGIEEVVGLFINSLPLRVSIQPERVCLEWLQSLLAQNLVMRQFEYAPLSEIQRWSEVPRGQALFDSLVVFENVPVDPSLRGHSLALDIQGYETRTHTNYPLTVVVIPGKELHLQITYDRTLFEASTVARLLGHYKALLESLVRYPEARLGDLTVLSEAEQRQILLDWNATDIKTPPTACYQALFESQVAQTPAAVAAVCGEETMTYAELNARANRVAQGLIAAGVGPETLVALLDERGIDFLTMILGVFKAGGAYLPLDPHYPLSRLQQTIELSQPKVVLTRKAYLFDGIAREGRSNAQPSAVIDIDELMEQPWPRHNPPVRMRGGNLAYVIYTSGSTGTPKGVLVEQRGLMNNLLSKVETLRLSPEHAIAQTASQCFDISVWQFLTALLCGARVEIFPDGISHDPVQLLRRVQQRGITVLELVPSMMAGMVEAGAERHDLPALRWLLPTGEALPAPIARRWMGAFPGVALLNAYGPAECSDDVAYHLLAEPPQDEGIVPIGRPISGLRLYLLNRQLQPVPVGVPGELYIAGVGVGRGYLGRPDLTAAAFIPHPFAMTPGERLYRSGDRARYRADGTIEFLGRIDHQVKIRGHRIELGEIEAGLVEHPQVRESVVSAKTYGTGDQRLVAYIVPVAATSSSTAGEGGGNHDISVEELRVFLKQSLPEYMVPSAFVILEQLPRTPNGKVDRNALPAPDFTRLPQTCYVPPRTPIEEGLVAIWAEVLKLKRVGVEDDFFELGGHSLLATQILSRVRAAFAVELPLRALFEATTVTALAKAVEAAQWLEAEPSAPPPNDLSDYEDFEI